MSNGVGRQSGVRIGSALRVGRVLVMGAWLASCTGQVGAAEDGGPARDGGPAPDTGATRDANGAMPDPCATAHCDPHASCSIATGAAVCTCEPGYTGDGASCTVTQDPCAAPGACPPGTWVNVTPAGMNLDPNWPRPNDNFGLGQAFVDPVRSSDLYLFVCYQGVWRSQDFGVTWAHISTGTAADILESGRPFTAAIGTDPHRDPSTPPTLYMGLGYGSRQGLLISNDGGVNWTVHDVLGQDIYSIDIDPYDSQHMITGLHESEGLLESNDGGLDWHWVTHGAGMGVSVYPFFVDTGDATSTRNTWVTIAQATGGDAGMWQTSDGGQSFSRVESLEHGHGSAQMFRAGPGVMYAAGVYGSGGWGVYRSLDAARTWSPLLDHNVSLVGVTGTQHYLYTWSGGATQGTIDPSWMRASRDLGTTWTSLPGTPAGMTNGPFHLAVTNDGSHDVLVGGFWLAGVWRYVEP